MPPVIAHPRLFDRTALLEAVVNMLDQSGRAAIAPPDRQLITHGWGLTRLGDELEHTHNKGVVIRLNAASEVQWHQDLVRVATELQLRARFLRQPQDAFLGVRKWLRENTDWLLIVDGLQEQERVADFLAPLQQGRIVLLARQAAQVPTGWGEVYRLPCLSTASAEAVLLEMSGLADPDAQLRNQFSSLAREVKYNPAALVACGVLVRQGCAVPGLLEQLQQAAKVQDLNTAIAQTLLWGLRSRNGMEPAELDLMAWQTPVSMTDHRPLVMTTGVRQALRLELLQVDAAPRLRAVSEKLLANLPVGERRPLEDTERVPRDQLAQALLDNGNDDALTFKLVQAAAVAARQVGGWLRGAEFGQRLLQRLKQTPEQHRNTIADVYLHVAHCMSDGERFALARRNLRYAVDHLHRRYEVSADALMDIVEIDLNENRIDTAVQRLEQVGKLHARAAVEGADVSRARRLFLRGATLVALKKYDDAVRVLQRSLALRMQLLPVDHPAVLQNLSLLARAAFALPDITLAEAVVRRDLHIRRNSQEVTEGEIAVPAHALADLLFSQGKYAVAEELYEEALRLREQLYMPDDRRISETLSRLAVLKSTRGAYREAEPLFRRALQLTEELFGENHPAVARVLNELAESLFAQGKYDQARRILERALRLQETTLRGNDAALSRTRNNLAALHVALSHFGTAQSLYEQDLAAKRKSLPANHPWVATTLNNLGEVLRSQGELDRAEPLLDEALRVREEVYGPRHPQVAQSLSNLGYVHLLQHRIPSARRLFERALAVREESLQALHPHRAASLACLAQTLVYDGELEAAREKYTAALEIAQAVYGPEHAQSTQLMTQVARLERRLGSRARAELSLLKAKAIQEKAIGPNHRFFGETLLGLGEGYQLEQKYEQAFPLLERALAIQRETMQGARFEIAETLLLLGKNLYARGIHQEAHDRLRECYRIWMGLLDLDHALLQECGELLGELAIQHGDPRQADMLLGEALARAEALGQAGAKKLGRLIPLVADARAKLGKHAEAEAMLQRQRELVAEQQGPESREMIAVLSHLAGVKYLSNDYSGSVALIEETVRLAERHYGPAHRETAKHLENLAGVYFLQERYTEAAPVIGRAVEILKAQLGPNDPAVQAALEKYSQLLRRTNQGDHAQKIDDNLSASRDVQSHVLDDLF